jgi:hypothetical protein
VVRSLHGDDGQSRFLFVTDRTARQAGWAMHACLVETFAHLEMHAQSQGLVCEAGGPVAISHMGDVDRCRESLSEEATVFNVRLCVNCFKCPTQTLGGRADLVM